MLINSEIIGSGHYLPETIVDNQDFLKSDFFETVGERNIKSNSEVIDKFQEITEIVQRRYEKTLLSSDMAKIASERALEAANIDRNKLDYVIVAHNYGDIKPHIGETDLVPSLSAKLKHKLQIDNPRCKPYDMIFGCPGWLEGIILSHQFIVSGFAENILVVGCETMSRKVDPHDRNSMIFADGAGATIISKVERKEKAGVLGYINQSDMKDDLYFLSNDVSLNPNYNANHTMVRMNGRKVYEYALKNVPKLIKELLDNNNLSIKDVDKILIHQANAKMDFAIADRIFKLYGLSDNHEKILPMTIREFGNSSVATIPTMYDRIIRNQMSDHRLNSGDRVVFASIGAGMNINAVLYKMP